MTLTHTIHPYMGITIDLCRDELLTEFGKFTLHDRYMMPNETSPQHMFARVAVAFCDDLVHAQRMYDYISLLWFMPSTPILSNGGTTRGMPISCFLNTIMDSRKSIADINGENMELAAQGGGLGTDWSNLRSIGEKVGEVGTSSGIIPFMVIQDAQTRAISQGNLRRGSAATYLNVWHPEIEEFINIRKPNGGDNNRKCLHLHHGIMINDAFMHAVENEEMYDLISPKTGEVIKQIDAFELWAKILIARMETGEPYVVFHDTVNRDINEWQKKANFKITQSNLCSEITLVTDEWRTAVCCLASANLEQYDQWEGNATFIKDVMRFLDNVLTVFIETAPEAMAKAVYSATQERSVGLGVMGFHGLLQSKNIPFESALATSWNHKIFSFIQRIADESSIELAIERGACPDAARYGYNERFSNKTAIAPTASISIIAANASPGVEPSAGNAYTQKTLSGTHSPRNIHLVKVLESYGKNNDEIWSSIITNDGSVQHLDFLSTWEKDVYKTAYELDQMWIIEHAAARTQYIDQSQSINVFLPPDINKVELHKIHYLAWKKGLKSLYYCRSKSLMSAHKVSHAVERVLIDEINTHPIDIPITLPNTGAGDIQYDECLSCQ